MEGKPLDTGLALCHCGQVYSDVVSTRVTFRTLEEAEIDRYIASGEPFDKAGGYGIQEWIGYVGIERIEGSFYNVMGLPVQRLYVELDRFITSANPLKVQ